MGVKSTKFRQSGRLIQYESSQRTGGGSTWIQRYKWTYVYSQGGATPGTFPVTSGQTYAFFGVASGGSGGYSSEGKPEGPGGTAGGGGGAAQTNGYLWTAPASGTVTVVTARGSDLSLTLPAVSPTTIFTLARGTTVTPTGASPNNPVAGGVIGSYGSEAGGAGGEGGARGTTSGSPGGNGSSRSLAGAGGGGAGSFYAYSSVYGRGSGGGGGAVHTEKSITTLNDPTTGFSWNVFLQDNSQGFRIVGTPGSPTVAEGAPTRPNSTPLPPLGGPHDAPNNGAQGANGGGGGGVRFTSTSPTLSDAYGGGGGAGSPNALGAHGYFIAFLIESSAT